MNAAARDGYLFLPLLQAKAGATGASIVTRLGVLDPATVPHMDSREFAQRLSPSEQRRDRP